MPAKRSSPHSCQLRSGRVSLAQQIYLVTMVTKSRVALFSAHEFAAIAARTLYHEDITRRADTLAFVVMPDHIHWLLQLGELASLSETVRLYKAKVSSVIGGGIWQAGFHDHALRANEEVTGVARYLVANPLRAGLCDSVGNYPYWNAAWI